MVAILHKGLGSKLCIEHNNLGCLYKLEDSVANYYYVLKCEFFVLDLLKLGSLDSISLCQDFNGWWMFIF